MTKRELEEEEYGLPDGLNYAANKADLVTEFRVGLDKDGLTWLTTVSYTKIDNDDEYIRHIHLYWYSELGMVTLAKDMVSFMKRLRSERHKFKPNASFDKLENGNYKLITF